MDAKGAILGRLAVQVANLLRGKHKPQYSPDRDTGDNVIIINCEHVVLTGKKADRNHGKVYYRHTGHPGGIKQITAGKLLEGETPQRVICKAVQRMMCKNRLNRKLISNLHVYAGSEHKHQAQQPKTFDLAAANNKNYKR
ncbi:MAG: 50S ribosomal protein L13 [Pseudomonadota bacterium]